LMKRMILVCFPALLCAVATQATTITYVTPSGSATTGGAVDASALFTTGAGTLDITLNNLEANPTDVAQLVSDLDFVLSTGQTVGTLTSSSGQQITVNSGGTFTLGSTGSTGWGLNNAVGGGLQLDALGFVGPAGLIIGPPSGSGTYSNANGSIAGNPAHNPFLNQTATFDLSVAGVTAATTITSATFSFGTTAGIDVPGTPGTPVSGVPEPATWGMLGTGLLALSIFGKRLRRA
jgi:hypothetical protein